MYCQDVGYNRFWDKKTTSALPGIGKWCDRMAHCLWHNLYIRWMKKLSWWRAARGGKLLEDGRITQAARLLTESILVVPTIVLISFMIFHELKSKIPFRKLWNIVILHVNTLGSFSTPVVFNAIFAFCGPHENNKNFLVISFSRGDRITKSQEISRSYVFPWQKGRHANGRLGSKMTPR